MQTLSDNFIAFIPRLQIFVAGSPGVEVTIYRGCQKNVPVFKRFFLQPLMPHFHSPEHYYGNRYNCVKTGIKKQPPSGAKKS